MLKAFVLKAQVVTHCDFVEKIQLVVIFFQIKFDLATEYTIIVFIVILHVYFARVAKGVGEYLDKINYSFKGE